MILQSKNSRYLVYNTLALPYQGAAKDSFKSKRMKEMGKDGRRKP